MSEATLRADNDDLIEQCKAYRERIAFEKKAVADLQAELAATNKKLEATHELWLGACRRNQELKEELELAKAANESVNIELSQMNNNYEEQGKELDVARALVADMRNRALVAEEEIRAQKKQIEKLLDELNASEEKRLELYKRNEELVKKVEELADNRQRLTDALAQLTGSKLVSKQALPIPFKLYNSEDKLVRTWPSRDAWLAERTLLASSLWRWGSVMDGDQTGPERWDVAIRSADELIYRSAGRGIGQETEGEL